MPMRGHQLPYVVLDFVDKRANFIRRDIRSFTDHFAGLAQQNHI